MGIGWEAGLLVGLAENRVDVAKADAVIGTSAGAVAGFTLAAGGDLTAATSLVQSASQLAPATPPPAPNAQADEMWAAMGEAVAHPERAEAIRAEIGRIALGAQTISDAQWLEMFAVFAGADWPAAYSCTAVNADDGSFRVWDKAAGVDPQVAIASSCAVPGVFPTVQIGDARWMDGGARDMLNADVAAGHDTILVVSCTLLELPPEFSVPPFDALFAATLAKLEGLRAAGSEVETIVPGPEMLEASGGGANLMDFTRAAEAYEAGVRQGKVEAARLAGFWDHMIER